MARSTMKPILLGLAALAVGTLGAVRDAEAQAAATPPLTELTDVTNEANLTREVLIGGTVPAICAFDPKSTNLITKLDLVNSGKPGLVKFGFTINCNFGRTYKAEVASTFGKLKNISEETIRDQDISYTARFYLQNSSQTSAWAGAGIVTDEVNGVPVTLRPDFSVSAPSTLSDEKIYTDRDIPVDAASGRSRVQLRGVVQLVENASSPLREGGFTWRAGVYSEVFTLTIAPTLSFADYCAGTQTFGFGGQAYTFKSCRANSGGGGGGGYKN